MQIANTTKTIQVTSPAKVGTVIMFMIIIGMTINYFMTLPKVIQITPKASITEGVSVNLDWNAKEEDWRAAFATLKAMKSIKSNTH